jgi:hypothetical protein
LLASSIVISQTSQEPPELAEASELTKSVAKLFDEKKFDEALPLAGDQRVKVKGVVRYNFVYQGTIWRMNPTLP